MQIIDMDTLEPQKESFLDEKLNEEFSDLLFRVMINNKEGYIYFLFEHKSYKDKMVIFQVLKYMISIWESKIKDNKDRRKVEGKSNSGEMELPVILPLVIYHANTEWNVERTLRNMIPNYKNLPDDLKRYIPDFEYLLIDLSDFSKHEVKLRSENMITIKALTRMRYASREETISILIEAIELINETEEKDDITYYVSACIRYILSVRDDISKNEMAKIAEQISTEGGELVMSVAERLIQESLEERMNIIAKTMIVEGEPIDKIMLYTRLTKEGIEEIKEELLK